MICGVVLPESYFYSGSVDCFCRRKFACWATIVLGSGRTEQAAVYNTVLISHLMRSSFPTSVQKWVPKPFHFINHPNRP